MFAGLIFVFGIVTAVFSYFRDKGSMDFSSITHAGSGAILHVVLWTIVAAVVFVYQMTRK